MQDVFAKPLPSIKTVKGDPNSTTDVKYLTAFIGRFDFFPWKDFDHKAHETVSLIRTTISANELLEPLKFLNVSCSLSRPPFLSNESLQRVYQSKFLGNLGLVGGSNTPAYRDVVFHDEASMSCLCDVIIQCVNSIFQMMAGSDKYRIVTGRIPSKLLDAAEKQIMRIQLESRLRQAKAKRLMNGAYERVRNSPGGYRKTRLKSQVAAVQMDVEGETSHEEAEASIPTTDSVTLNSEEKRELQNLIDKQKESPGHLIPDYCLMLSRGLNPAAGNPICCIELKAPYKNVTGREREATRGSTLSSGMVLSEDDLVNIPLHHQGDNADLLAKRLSAIMADSSEELPVLRGRNSARKAISQAIAYAMETGSGMAYLWNWGDGVVLHVMPHENENGFSSGRATVAVSLVNETMSSQVGHIGSMVHFCRVAAAEADSIDKARRLEGMRAVISNAMAGENAPVSGSGSEDVSRFAHAQSSEGNLSLFEHTQRALPPHQGSSRPIEMSINLSGPRQKFSHMRNCDGKALSPDAVDYPNHQFEVGKLKLPPIHDREAMGSSTTISKQAETSSSRGVEYFLLGNSYLDDPTEEDVVAVLALPSTKIGKGVSGSVFQASLGGILFAIKLWNKESFVGLKSLRIEVEWYQWLQTFYPKTLGSAVPMVRMCWNFGDLSYCIENVGLVLDFVGRAIHYKGDGVFGLSERGSSQREELEVYGVETQAICNAAPQSLSEIHASEILHGDVELRNLRVDFYELSDERGETWEGYRFRWKA